MDFLLSIRKEFHFGFSRGRNGNQWGYGLFLGWITLVVTNMPLLRAAVEAQEDYIERSYPNESNTGV